MGKLNDEMFKVMNIIEKHKLSDNQLIHILRYIASDIPEMTLGVCNQEGYGHYFRFKGFTPIKLDQTTFVHYLLPYMCLDDYSSIIDFINEYC